MPFPIADRWFEKTKIDDDITLIYEPHVVPFLRCNIWHIRGRHRDLVIDTGTGLMSLASFAKDILGSKVSAVATHVHMDHVGCHHEFDHCLVHSLEAEGLRNPSGAMNLVDNGFDASDVATLYLPSIDDPEIAGPMVTALPYDGFDLSSYQLRPAKGVACVNEGDVIDLGDRAFEVVHLPGHSPGSIGLWEASTGVLFSGDAIYDGPLIDDLHHSDITEYERTMRRLRAMPITKVHAGHDPSFGRDRLLQLIDEQLKHWGKLYG
ncbi:MBL fold metallo-hydrolase [Sulfitobacter sp.]|jgi:glyoxylase-like metal-dependent hydrolase (beta-lactamase superfamily II)|uniref:MBL fold metallo-hydrolase n=1 Tax=Sulfitobacter sp. TaxID=1903071 RepID=UPI0039E4D208